MANRTKMVVMRLRPAEHEELIKLAKRAEVSVSQLVRELALREIQGRDYTSKLHRVSRVRRRSIP